MKIDGCVAVVTGGARGIGLEITRALLRNGAKVFFLDVDDLQGKETEIKLRASFGDDRVTFINCDVTSGTQFRDILTKTSMQNDGIDLLCNNAGVLDNENWKKMLDINLIAMIQGTMIGLDLMDKEKGQKGGVIINIASLAGFVPYPYSPVYAASKHGVIGFSRSVAEIAAGKGIRLSLLCPAFVTTRMTTSVTDTDWLKMIEEVGCVTPERVAEGFIQLVKDDTRDGQAMRVTVQNGFDFHKFTTVDDLI